MNIINLASSKSKLLHMSVLAADLFTFIGGFHIEFTIAHSLPQMFGRNVNPTMHTDTRSIYDLWI